MALTQVSDIITPEIFTPYVQQMTEEKSRIIQSGLMQRSGVLDTLLAGGGLTFNVPSFQDLDSSDGSGAENVSGDQPADVQTLAAGAGTTLAAQNDARPQKTTTSNEVATRMSRNNHWSTASLSKALAGDDPQASIASRVAEYWSRRLQRATVRTLTGVFADNTANDAGDYSVDITGAGFEDGVTNFRPEALIDASLTMGDSMEDLTGIIVHSVVYAQMQKQNLIDFIPDARGEVRIPTYLGKEVIVDDGVPAAGGIYESWLFAAGVLQLGVGTPDVPTAMTREELAGQGGGQDILHSRVEWSIHPTGHAYTTTPGNGGPTDANLIDAANWNRVYPERKQIKLARLITREA